MEDHAAAVILLLMRDFPDASYNGPISVQISLLLRFDVNLVCCFRCFDAQGQVLTDLECANVDCAPRIALFGPKCRKRECDGPLSHFPGLVWHRIIGHSKTAN
jgi:hypothetical protein